jgi:hypothetical protein
MTPRALKSQFFAAEAVTKFRDAFGRAARGPDR